MKLPFVSLSFSPRPLQSSSQCIASNYLASSKPLAPASQCIAPPYLSATASKSPPAYIWLNLAQDKQARELQRVLETNYNLATNIGDRSDMDNIRLPFP